MKRILSVFLSMVLFFGCFSQIAIQANATPETPAVKGTSDGFLYSVSDGNVTITGYTGSAASLIIPGTIEGCPVTEIGFWAFSDHTNLTSVVIPDGVVTIGAWAFCGCSNLVNVSIPDSVTSVGSYAFFDCSVLNCNSYDMAEYLGNKHNPFVVLISAASTSITFCNVHPDTNVIYPYAFSDCTKLTRITLPDSVVSIEASAFQNCSKLAAIDLPDSITAISPAMFYGCSSLTGIVIPDGVTYIGEGAFCDCTSLTSVTIPDSVTDIDHSAFFNCSSLVSIRIPTSVTKIEIYAFADCDSLETVYYAGSREQWDAIAINVSNECLTEANIIFLNGELIPGDLDGNSAVNREDVIALLLHVSMPGAFPVFAPADFSGDGAVTRDDVVALLLHVSMPDAFPLTN